MANKFLKKVATDVVQKFPDYISHIRFVFPNKRPGLYFKNELAQLIDNPIMAPQTNSIDEFIFANSKLEVKEPTFLLYELFKINRIYQPDDTFDSFINWGKMLLRDFDEIDSYLIDTTKFFNHLLAAKELENIDFNLENNNTKKGSLESKFFETWEQYAEIYKTFRKNLLENNFAYSGMCYREVAELIEGNKLELEDKKIVFIGFNAVTKAEEQIITTLCNNDKAVAYWDTDSYYMKDDIQEAGYFIKKTLRKIKKPLLPKADNALEKEAKNIHITGAMLQMGQAKALGNIFNHLKKSQVKGSTVIILPDQSLLMPALYSLNQDGIKLNVTSGIPLSQTSIQNLIDLLLNLQKNYVNEADAFYFKDVIAILTHPLIKSKKSEEIEKLLKEIVEEELIYINSQTLDRYDSDPIIKTLLKPQGTVEEFSNYFSRFFELIGNYIHPQQVIEYDALKLVQEIPQQIEDVLGSNISEIGVSSWLKLFREKFSEKYIVVENKDADAIQLMGMLETRALDFDNVIILSMNEGNFPLKQVSSTYIPFDIRKAHGLPTSDEQEKLYAYYFYRHIQHADNIHLIYNAENTKAEPSRYIGQIEEYLTKANPLIKIQKHQYNLPIENTEALKIQFKKTPAFFTYLGEKAKSGISPSWIANYYTCSLQFHFKNIVRIPVSEPIEEDWKSNKLGDAFHKLMERIYKEKIGKEVNVAFIENQKSKIEEFILDVLKYNNDSDYQETSTKQRNIIQLKTLHLLAETVLDIDIQNAPFKIVSLEEEVRGTITLENGQEIHLKGIIDRVDQKDNSLRIVDYKTGKVENFSHDFSKKPDFNIKSKEVFQTNFYAYLYHKKYSTDSIKSVIYNLKPSNNEDHVKEIINYNDSSIETAFNPFEEVLKNVLTRIFDPEDTISQPEKDDLCVYCDYKNICIRS